MTDFTSKINSFLNQGKTSDALLVLLELSQNNRQIHDSILSVVPELNEMNARRLRGTISSEEVALIQVRINEKVLLALKSFDSEGRVLPGRAEKNNAAIALLGKITLFIVLGLGGIFILSSFNFGDYAKTMLFIGVTIFYLGLISFAGYIIALVIRAVNAK